MLAYQGPRKGELAVLILAEGKVQVFQEPLVCEGHQFFFSNPVDVEFDECLQLPAIIFWELTLSIVTFCHCAHTFISAIIVCTVYHILASSARDF